MNNSGKYDYTQIDLYIHKLMTEPEAKAFERQLSLDTDLADEVELRRFILMHQAATLKSKLRRLYEQVEQETYEDVRSEQPVEETKSAQPFLLFILHPARLALLAVVLLGIFILVTPSARNYVSALINPSPPQDTTRQPQYRPPVEPINTVAALQTKVDTYISRSTQPRPGIPGSLVPAIRQFEQKNFAQAQQLLQKAPKNRPGTERPSQSEDELVFGATNDSSTVNNPDPNAGNLRVESYRTFYGGLIYLAEGNTNRALTNLQKVKGTLQPEAQWYLSLTYLKRMDTTQAKPLLKSISQNAKNPHAREANELLSTLNQ